MNAETDVYLHRWSTYGNINREHHLTVLYHAKILKKKDVNYLYYLHIIYSIILTPTIFLILYILAFINDLKSSLTLDRTRLSTLYRGKRQQ